MKCQQIRQMSKDDTRKEVKTLARTLRNVRVMSARPRVTADPSLFVDENSLILIIGSLFRRD